MYSPEDTLAAARDRAAEITWWNRRLTKLDKIPGVDNVESFLRDELIETKGPYVEYVDAPAKDNISARSRLRNLGYQDDIISALETALFGGDNGSLYQHQAEMLEQIETSSKDGILTVPTATGKTETFFLPVLKSCLETPEPGTKAIVVYPMKTLAVDQLNRFIAYLHQINRTRNQDDQITIGIWDGDTPTGVGDREREIEAGSYVRGLEDPISEEKLKIGPDGIVGTDARDFHWLKTTRNRVQNGAGILLATPEALDHLTVSESADRRSVLGNSDNEHPVQHIVFDEAHVWSGISGAGISLLVKRLKYFYREYDPQVSLVSATIKNPKELAASLTGNSEEDVGAVDFTPRNLSFNGIPKYDRFEPCSATELISALAAVQLEKGITQDEFSANYEGLAEAIQTAVEAGLVTKSPHRITAHEWLEHQLNSAITETLDNSCISDVEDVIKTKAGRNALTEKVLDDSSAESEWFEFVQSQIPEVGAFGDWVQADTVGAVGFKHLDAVTEHLNSRVSGQASGYLPIILTFGRLAGVVTDRYHAFLKPPRKVFWCTQCQHLKRRDICRDCGLEALDEIQFCKHCHYPFWLQESTDGEEADRIPVSGGGAATRCPECETSLNTQDIGVPTSSLLSYMLSQICRQTDSSKVLVFSDSHSAAESVSQRIQGTEYGLMAEALYVKQLLDNNGTAPLSELYRGVDQQLRTAYFDPFYDTHMDQGGPAYNMIQQLRKQVSEEANLYKTSHLLSEGIVTSEVLYQEADATMELIVGHEIYKRFADSKSVSFTEQGIGFNCLPVSKIRERVYRALPNCEKDLDGIINEFISAFYKEGILHEREFHKARATLNNQAEEPTKSEVFDYLIERGDTFAELIGTEPNQIKSGLLLRHHNQDQTNLRLLTHVAICETCWSTFPVLKDDELSCCLECGETIDSFDRFTIDAQGEYQGAGFADIDSTSQWPRDHWASDIISLLDDKGPEFVTVGIHKGNIPSTLRGAIEEGFRNDPPAINIVSSTPTMELGVDIGTLETVAQVGMPPTLTNYVQRSGRTGRSQGSSSLVITTVRGQHPVDNHYYDDLDRFFENFEPVRVPPAEEFEPVIASHVVTEVFSFLARTQDQMNTFERAYAVTDRDLTAAEFVDEIRNNVNQFCELITGEWRKPIRERIEEIFGEPGLAALEQVFEDKGALNFQYRINQTYGTVGDNSEANVDDLRANANRLNLWLDHIGFLASYRSFGQDFPIQVEGYKESIHFESAGRLYDMFPGPDNGLGAVFSLGGDQYIIDDATAGSPLTATSICTNEECNRPFQSYQTEQDICTHCDEPLEETKVRQIESMHARPAYGREDQWSTQGLHTTHVESTSAPDESVAKTEIAGLSTTITIGEFQLTDFVYAHERRHSSSANTKLRRSEARVENANRADSHAPVGTQYLTAGIQLEIDRKELEARFNGDPPWSQLAVSIQQALKRTIAVLGRFDLDDFQVTTTLTPDSLTVAITDAQFGGNGIAWRLESMLPEELELELKNIINCDNCASFCEQCLLLPRTPAYCLEKDLLNRQTVLTALGSGQD